MERFANWQPLHKDVYMKLEFTLEQLLLLDRALQQQPYYMAAPLIDSINTQLKQHQEISDVPINIKSSGDGDHV